MRIRYVQLTQNHNQRRYAWYPRRPVASFPIERSSEVTLWRHRVAVRFLPITFDRNELETWGWCHSVRLVKATSTDMQHDLLRSHCDLNPRPDREGGWCTPPPPGVFRRAEFWGTLWDKPCATFGKKKWPGQVRSRSYDVIRRTTSGNFTNKSVFYSTLTWRHWCKW